MVEEMTAMPTNTVITPGTGRMSVTGGKPSVVVTQSVAPTEVGTYPVAKNNMVRLLALRPMTQGAVETLIKHLQMGVDVGIYPDIDDEPSEEK